MNDVPSSDEANRETLKRDPSQNPDSGALQPGQFIGRFRLQSILGRGGMGEVWKAYDPELSRTVAIKFLLGVSLEDQKRFQKEAQVVAGLGHPNIAPVHEVGSHAGRSFIVLQYLDGTTIDRARLGFEEMLKAVRDAARVLDHAHQRGVVHRDIKPTNLMVSGGQIYVMDFGLARTMEARSSVSLTGTVVGTPAYMSPEQARGDSKRLDARTDVYSLGATLYELLTAQPPFPGQDLYAILDKVVTQEPTPPRRHNPRIPAEVETIVQKAMDKDPDRRYSSAAALAEDLDRFLSGKPILARPPSLLYRLKKHILRNPVAWTAAVIAVAAALVAAGVFVSGRVEGQRKSAAYLEAAELSRRATASARDAAALYRVRTSTYEEREKLFVEAVRLARAAIQKAPDLAGPHYTLGQILEARHQWSDAIDAYDQAVRIDPNLAEALYHRCVCRLEVYESVVNPVVRIERTGLREPLQARQARGEALLKAVRADMDRYRASRGKVDETSREERYVQAGIAFAEKQFQVSRQMAQQLLTETRTNEMVWFLLARSQSGQNRLTEAIETMTDLIENVMPQHSRAWHARALYKGRLEDHRGARDDFARAVQLDPKEARSHWGLAREELRLKNWSAALRAFDAGIALQEPEARAVQGRGEARERTGDLDGALQDYEAALRIEPGAGSVYYDRGRVRIKKGDREGGIADQTKAADKTALATRAQATRMLEYWSKEVEWDPEDAWSWFQRGVTKRVKGDVPGAIEDLSKAIAVNPLFAAALRQRAELREATDPKAAAQDYAAALEAAPKNWSQRAACEAALARLRATK